MVTQRHENGIKLYFSKGKQWSICMTSEKFLKKRSTYKSKLISVWNDIFIDVDDRNMV